MEQLNFYYQILSWVDGICGILIDAYCCVIWTKPFLNRRNHAWLTGGAYAATMLILNFMPQYITPMLAYILGALAVFLVMCLFNREFIFQKLFLSITFFCLRWQASRIVVYICNEIDMLAYRTFPSDDYVFWFKYSVFAAVIFDILAFLFQYGSVKCILWSYGQKREHMNIREFLLLSMPSLAGVVSYGVIRYYDGIYQRDTGKSVYTLYGSHDLIMALFTLLTFTVILVTTYTFRQWKTQQENDRQREIFSTQMADLQSHINEVEQLYRDIRSLRHDMGNHLMTVKQLYEKGEYETAQQYTDKLNEEMTKPSLDINSGNPVTDVILSGRKKEMDGKKIAFSYDFHYPMTKSVNSFDISIILNNALSNAIEAVEREMTSTNKTPRISLLSSRRKNMYIIEVANSYMGNLEIDPASGLPHTSKTEEGHGFGLSGIRHVAHKYLGDLEIGKEIYEGEECCVLRVMLQIPES